MNQDLNLDKSILPTKQQRIIFTLPTIFEIRVDPKMNQNTILAEIEKNYSFDENGFKYIKPPGNPDDKSGDVAISGDYEDYFPENEKDDANFLKEVEDEKRDRTNTQIQALSKDNVEDFDISIKREDPLQNINKREKKHVPKEKNLFDLVNNVVQKSLANHFNHFRILTSNQHLKIFLKSLYQWKLLNSEHKKEKLMGQVQHFKQGLLFYLRNLVMRRQEYGFQKIAVYDKLRKFDIMKKFAPVALKANLAHRKNLKDVLTYWYHVKNDNRWFTRILRAMILKSSLDPQIALWRLKLFRRNRSPVDPRLVKGLLRVIDLARGQEVGVLERGLLQARGAAGPRLRAIGRRRRARLQPNRLQQRGQLARAIRSARVERRKHHHSGARVRDVGDGEGGAHGDGAQSARAVRKLPLRLEEETARPLPSVAQVRAPRQPAHQVCKARQRPLLAFAQQFGRGHARA